MNAVRLAARLYAAFLHLYPADFRTMLGDEMLEVFTKTLEDSARQGWTGFLQVCWRELRDLPGALAAAHRPHPIPGEWIMKPNRSFWGSSSQPPDTFSPRPWREVWLAGLFFTGYFLAALLDDSSRSGAIPRIIPDIASTLFLLFCLGVLLWSSFHAFPDWSLLYLGLGFAAAALLVLFAIFPLPANIWIAITYFLIPAMLIAAARGIKPLRSLWMNTWQDPTRLGFLYLGVMVFSYNFITEDVPGSAIHRLFYVLTLLPVAVAYLRCCRTWQRAILLPLGFLASWIAQTLMDPSLFLKPFAYAWRHGLGTQTVVGLLILLWFCLPGILILLRRRFGAHPAPA